MRCRALGRTGLQVSELGFGSWGIGGGLWTDSSDADSLAALRRALELGVNLFDTAYVYGDGHSEELIGRVLRETGRRAYVATKVPPKNKSWPSSGGIAEAFPADWVVACTERSLRKLGVDSVELQQLHVWNDGWLDDPAFEDTRAALERLTREGKIRFWGVSIDARKPGTAVRLVRSGLPHAIQAIYNLFHQEPADELFPACREHGVGVLVRVPFDEGGLTGRLSEDSRFPEGDFRANYFAGRLLGETVRRAKALERELVGGDAPDLAAAALRYCLSDPAVSTVIPGMRRPTHVEANARASEAPPYPPPRLAALRAHAWKRDLAPA
ncbi:MAG: aldo/keto reductase [Elusimicrobia bacterium]|nr:aldo/keto reductase [Elusimicrobiota bacterium]